jgi:hypothetical protein
MPYIFTFMASWERRRPAGQLLAIAIFKQNVRHCPFFGFFDKEPPRRRRSQEFPVTPADDRGACS